MKKNIYEEQWWLLFLMYQQTSYLIKSSGVSENLDPVPTQEITDDTISHLGGAVSHIDLTLHQTTFPACNFTPEMCSVFWGGFLRCSVAVAVSQRKSGPKLSRSAQPRLT